MALQQESVIQFNETNEKFKNSGTVQQQQYIPSAIFSPIQQLGLMVDIKNTEDVGELNMILNNILHFPSNQLAQIHKEANKLGNHDIRSEDLKEIKVREESQLNAKAVFCPCCGFIKQEEQIKLCTKFQQINNIGISTFLYFQTVKNVIALMIIMCLSYGIFALATNIKASQINQSDSYIPADILSISLGAKQKNPTDINKRYYFIQAWIGLAMIITWGFVIIILKYFQNKEQNRVQNQTKSAADFSIIIQNLPSQITEEQLQNQLNQYYKTITNVAANLKKPFKIKKFNKGKPFYLNQNDFKDDQLERLVKQSEEMKNTFREIIIQRKSSATFSQTKQSRQALYKKYDELLKKRQQKVLEVANKVKQQFKKSNNNEQTSTVFITFDCSHARQLICSQNATEFSSKVRYYLSCCRNQNLFRILKQNGELFDIKIQRAPEPEDVIWTNLGVASFQKIKRKIITFVVTFILLGASFGAVAGLSYAQINNANNRILSFIISLLISVINAILGQVIRKLTIYERDYTQTKHQTSLAIKSVFAMLINSILVPIFADYYIKTNMYAKNGLAEDIFYLSITNALLPPILKILDGYYLFTRILAWWKKRINSRLYSNQLSLNVANQMLFFEVGYEYIYVVNLFLFTCFFIALQPIIVFFAILGLFSMYWAQKYCLFVRTKRPVPGTDLVNTAMSQWVLFAGIAYSLGSLTWSNFIVDGIPKQALLPNLISLGFGIALFLAPYETIFEVIFSDEITVNLLYDEYRLYLASEYDRLNPSTAEEAFKEYIAFIEKFKEEMKNASDTKKNQIAIKFLQQGQRGNQRPSNQMLPNFAQNFFGSSQSNTIAVNPFMMGGFNNMNNMNNGMMNSGMNNGMVNNNMMNNMMNQQNMPNMNQNMNPINQLPINNMLNSNNNNRPPPFQQQQQQQFNNNPINFQQPVQFGFQQQPFQQQPFQQRQNFGFNNAQPQFNSNFGFNNNGGFGGFGGFNGGFGGFNGGFGGFNGGFGGFRGF